MSETQELMIQSTRRMFSEQCTPAILAEAEQGHWPTALWETVQEMGLPLVAIPEALGGVGGSLNDAIAILRLAGQVAAPIPLAEVILAGLIMAAGEVALPDGLLTASVSAVPPTFTYTGSDWHLSGTLQHASYARYADWTIISGWADYEDTHRLALVNLADVTITPQHNIALEPRETLTFEQTPLTLIEAPIASHATIWAWGALLRSAQMVGALETILERSLYYASEREQFGRPIAKFQAIQQYLAQLAGEVAAARAALEAATKMAAATLLTEAPVSGQDRLNARAAIAMAKIRVGEAAGTASRIAHQVHGAMGFTYEYPLHFFTKRLWAWREEFGSESDWAEWLGKHLATLGAENLWAFMTMA